MWLHPLRLLSRAAIAVHGLRRLSNSNRKTTVDDRAGVTTADIRGTISGLRGEDRDSLLAQIVAVRLSSTGQYLLKQSKLVADQMRQQEITAHVLPAGLSKAGSGVGMIQQVRQLRGTSLDIMGEEP